MKYKIIPSKQFKRDLKKYELSVLNEWIEIGNCLVNNIKIPDKYRDHALVGNMSGFRECHIKPDLLLIYAKQSETIELVRLGTHSEIFK